MRRMALADDTDRDDVDLVVDVMVGAPGEEPFNTVVLGGTDVIVPLERDLDGDPYQDDEVWLENLEGSFREKRLSSDPDVVSDEDNNVLLYHFRHVPFGVYNVVAVVAARPILVYSGLVVRKDGVFMGEEKLTEEYDPCSPDESDEGETPSDEENGTDDGSAENEPMPATEQGGDEDEPIDGYDEAFDLED
jgi:hypothetical protein